MSKESKTYKNLPKKVYIRTFGCQMNVRDSEVICGLLENAGYKMCATEKQAEIIIFNTCSVRQHAEDRVWSLIGSYKGSKIIGLVGCMAQHHKERAFQRDANVSFVVGPQDIYKLPEILGRLSPKGLFQRRIWETDSLVRPDEIYHTGFFRDKNHAYIVISEGCSNFCSYCIVPYVRGRLRHRESKNILKEAENAVSNGITKITLLGQNVNAYKNDGLNFAKLLERLNAINGLKELSFFTSHPKDATRDFFKVIRDLDKLAKSLHLPLQSGSNRILKLMNRGYERKEYLALIDSYRKIVVGGLLTSDIIVGFPSESENDFMQTFDCVKKAEFNAAYIFKYSPRQGTLAAKMADDVDRQEKEKRHKEILDLQRKISNHFLIFFAFLFFPAFCWSAELDALKADFLRGNYRRVIFEAEAYGDRISDESSFILGLSYLKESNLTKAEESFKRILKSPSSKLETQASLGLADTYLIAGQLQEAEDIYHKLINEDANSSLKAALLYRLSQSGFKKGDNAQGNEFLSKLRRDFPLSLELKLTRGIPRIEPALKEAGEYSVQVGFFGNSENANNLKEKLRVLGYPAYVEAAIGGYRVRVGRFKFQAEALDLENKLSKEGFPTKVCP